MSNFPGEQSIAVQPTRANFHLRRRSVLVMSLMGATAAAPLAIQLRPRQSRTEPPFDLETLVPTQLGRWRAVDQGATQVINPQLERLLDKVYSQLLSRTYVHSDGYAIMLSIAYGNEQRGGLNAHEPEACYPAQGFTLVDRSRTKITPLGEPIEVKRIVARMGSRNEPLTYWFKLGDRTLSGASSLDRRLVQLRFALSGHVPDGLLFRVSSIDDQRDRAYARQDGFIADLLAAASPAGRRRLVGDPRR